jgi:predicted DNA-binding transcriptional regulator AlpA
MPDAVVLSTRIAADASDHAPSLRPLPTDDRLIAARDLPQYVGLAEQTLARLRCEGERGPPFVRVGRLIYYLASDVREWLDGNRHRNTIYIAPKTSNRCAVSKT